MESKVLQDTVENLDIERVISIIKDNIVIHTTPDDVLDALIGGAHLLAMKMRYERDKPKQA